MPVPFLGEIAPVLTLPAKSLGRLVKPFKGRNAGRSEWIAIEPGNEADEIDRRRNAAMLHMRFRQSQIARATQVKGTHSVGNSCFDPGS